MRRCAKNGRMTQFYRMCISPLKQYSVICSRVTVCLVSDKLCIQNIDVSYLSILMRCRHFTRYLTHHDDKNECTQKLTPDHDQCDTLSVQNMLSQSKDTINSVHIGKFSAKITCASHVYMSAANCSWETRNGTRHIRFERQCN